MASGLFDATRRWCGLSGGAPVRAGGEQGIVVVRVIVLAAALVAALLSGALASAEEQQVRYELSLPKAVQQALERAPELTLARLAVAEADIALREAALGELVGRPRSEYEQAVLGVREARDSFADALVQVALKVEEAYYGVLRAAELLHIQTSNQEQADRQFALTKARYEAGLIARQDFLEAEASYQASSSGLERAQRTYAEAVRQLALLIGLPENAELVLTEQFEFEPWSVPLDAAVNEALAQRSDIERARRVVEQAENQLAQANAPYAAPIERVRAELQLERALVQYEQAAANVASQVRQEWFALKDAERDVDTARRREELALSRAEINRARYEAGAVALLDLLQSEAAYAQARLDAAGAVWDYNLAKARFLRTLGRSELPPLPQSVAEYIDSWDELD